MRTAVLVRPVATHLSEAVEFTTTGVATLLIEGGRDCPVHVVGQPVTVSADSAGGLADAVAALGARDDLVSFLRGAEPCQACVTVAKVAHAENLGPEHTKS